MQRQASASLPIGRMATDPVVCGCRLWELGSACTPDGVAQLSDRHEVIHADALHDEELAWAVRLAVHVMRGLRRQCAALTRHEPIDVARCPRLDHHRPLKTNEVVAVAAPSIVPIVQLSSAEAAHMSDPRAETAEPSCTVKSRPTGEPGEAMEATGAKSQAGEPAEGIAVAIIRPVIVTRPTLGIVAAARPD